MFNEENARRGVTVYVHDREAVLVCDCVQRTLWSWLSLSTFMWVPGTKLRLSGFAAAALTC